MFRGTLILLLAALIVGTGTACSDARGRLDEVRSDAEQLSDTALFCLSVTRAVTAIEAGSPATAAEAAIEVLARAPDDIRDDAQLVVSALQEANAGDRAAIEAPEFDAAVERLRARTRELCDPTT